MFDGWLLLGLLGFFGLSYGLVAGLQKLMER